MVQISAADYIFPSFEYSHLLLKRQDLYFNFCNLITMWDIWIFLACEMSKKTIGPVGRGKTSIWESSWDRKHSKGS